MLKPYIFNSKKTFLLFQLSINIMKTAFLSLQSKKECLFVIIFLRFMLFFQIFTNGIDFEYWIIVKKIIKKKIP